MVVTGEQRHAPALAVTEMLSPASAVVATPDALALAALLALTGSVTEEMLNGSTVTVKLVSAVAPN